MVQVRSAAFSCTAGHHFQRCYLRLSLQSLPITKLCFVIPNVCEESTQAPPRYFTAFSMTRRLLLARFAFSCTAGHHFQRCYLRLSQQSLPITKLCFVIPNVCEESTQAPPRYFTAFSMTRRLLLARFAFFVHRRASLSAMLPATFTAKLADNKTLFCHSI